MSASAVPAGPRVLADVIPGERVRDVLLTVGFAVAIAVAAQAQFTLPGTVVPVTGQTFIVLAGAIALGVGRATAGSLLYLVLGTIGLPWFSGAGVHTFGYIVGFVVASAAIGMLASRGRARNPGSVALVMLVGNVIIWTCGAFGLSVVLGVSLTEAVTVGVVPFILGDALKLAAAVLTVPTLWRLLDRG